MRHKDRTGMGNLRTRTSQPAIPVSNTSRLHAKNSIVSLESFRLKAYQPFSTGKSAYRVPTSNVMMPLDKPTLN
jgi:hypothetical protein